MKIFDMLPLSTILFSVMISKTKAFTQIPSLSSPAFQIQRSLQSPLFLSNNEINYDHKKIVNDAKKAFGALAIATALTLTTSPAPPAFADDFAGDTVTEMVKTIKTTAGDQEKTFAAFEELAAIITEGKGIGGDVSYGGVQLERGQISDEDTTIYNPGLSLLTESEKNQLVKAIVENKQKAVSTNTWSENNQLGFEFLKTKLDPLHMYELSGYLAVVPFYGAGVYLAALAVQQNFRGLFSAAYIAAALAVFLPIGLFVALGP